MKASILNHEHSLPNFSTLRQKFKATEKQNFNKKIKEKAKIAEEVKEEQHGEVNVFDEITAYLNKRKLRLVNPDSEFYMRMPAYQS